MSESFYLELTSAGKSNALLKQIFSNEDWSDSDCLSIFQHQMNTPVECELYYLLDTVYDEHALKGVFTCETFSDVLLHTSPSQEQLLFVKEYAKKIYSDTEYPKSVAFVLYTLALFQAFQNDYETITSLSKTDLNKNINICFSFKWLPSDIRKQFT